jgi:hypothetical protein
MHIYKYEVVLPSSKPVTDLSGDDSIAYIILSGGSPVRSVGQVRFYADGTQLPEPTSRPPDQPPWTILNFNLSQFQAVLDLLRNEQTIDLQLNRLVALQDRGRRRRFLRRRARS